MGILTVEQRRARAFGLAEVLRQSLADHQSPAEIARVLAETLEPEEVREISQELMQILPEQEFPRIGEVLEDLVAGRRHPAMLEDDQLEVPGPAHYHAVREALALNTFHQIEESPWPTAYLQGGGARGIAQLRPPIMNNQPIIPPDELLHMTRMMWKQREELSDLDADMLDALSAMWLSVARSPKDDAVAGVDDLLALRRVQPKINGCGRRGGYRSEQKEDVLRSLWHLQNLWVHMLDVEVTDVDNGGGARRRTQNMAIQSVAFVITDRMGQYRLDGYMDVERFVFRPGTVFARFLFGPGRQTALLAARALQYDPYKQNWEKRLTRFLSWQWKAGPTGEVLPGQFGVRALLQVVGENNTRLGRARDRLEKVLETLREDLVISGWRYHPEMDHRRVKNWSNEWLRARVEFDPPPELRQYFQAMRNCQAATPLPEPSLGAQLRQRREALRLTQAETARELDISQGYLSQLERGLVPTDKLSRDLRDRLQHWLQGS